MFNYNELALFAGAGGGILGGHLLGWSTVCAVEIEPYPREVLLARQRDGMLPPFPIWDDVSTFDGKPWRGVVDVVSGGFPCQDISSAGGGAGITGKRSGLWTQMLRIIREVRPRYAFMENSPMLTSRGLGTVLGGLAEAGYNAEWLCLSAADFNAPHKRERIWILAQSKDSVPHPRVSQRERERLSSRDEASDSRTWHSRCNRSLGGKAWQIEPLLDRVVDGVANWVDRLKAIGNGQVPLVAATAFRILHHRLNQQL